jgi:hypothetical protein
MLSMIISGIKLFADSEFGRNPEWQNPFATSSKEDQHSTPESGALRTLVMAADRWVFSSLNGNYEIFRFDKGGELCGAVWQEGQAPG